MTAFVVLTIAAATAVYVWCATHPQNVAEGPPEDRRVSVLGSATWDDVA